MANIVVLFGRCGLLSEIRWAFFRSFSFVISFFFPNMAYSSRGGSWDGSLDVQYFEEYDGEFDFLLVCSWYILIVETILCFGTFWLELSEWMIVYPYSHRHVWPHREWATLKRDAYYEI